MSVVAREFALDDRDFRFLAGLINEHTGIMIGDTKRDMIYSRIMRRLRELKIESFNAYCNLLQDKNAGATEIEHFINALTTNLTSFFREVHHFDYLRKTLLPAFVQSKRDRRLRIWSAGCSSGEEPYSIAMVLAEELPAGWDARILATDLDSNMLREAEAGIYPLNRLGQVCETRLRRWFQRGQGNQEGLARTTPTLRSMISFRQLNLLHPWPFKNKFDLIFCRNVVIYFNKETQARLFDRFADVLASNGHLFLGHSESLFQKNDRFTLIGNTIYRRLNP